MGLISQAFGHSGKFFSVLKDFRENIEFAEQDIRKELPEGIFHLILCRNLVFTYFDEQQQRIILLERSSESFCQATFSLSVFMNRSLRETSA